MLLGSPDIVGMARMPFAKLHAGEKGIIGSGNLITRTRGSRAGDCGGITCEAILLGCAEAEPGAKALAWEDSVSILSAAFRYEIERGERGQPSGRTLRICVNPA
jgi:hypothetical protein